MYSCVYLIVKKKFIKIYYFNSKTKKNEAICFRINENDENDENDGNDEIDKIFIDIETLDKSHLDRLGEHDDDDDNDDDDNDDDDNDDDDNDDDKIYNLIENEDDFWGNPCEFIQQITEEDESFMQQ
jgi:hypothetical protein